jgi:hypothetical protein
MALAEAEFPGWLSRLLTHPIAGLERHREMMHTLTSGTDVIKVFCQVAPLPSIGQPAGMSARMAGAAGNALL